MKTRLLKKVRKVARRIFKNKLRRFETTWGRVCGISFAHGYAWAFDWLMGERLDYYEDMDKIIAKIARLLWKREEREYWRRRLLIKKGKVAK